jgi:siderophore synthetase component
VLLTGPVLSADDATATALLNCLVREVCQPERQAWADGAHLMIRLARAGVLLRARLARPSGCFGHRLTVPVEELREEDWLPMGWQRLADLIAGELELTTGVANPEFLGQVGDSHTALSVLAGLPPRQAEPGPIGAFLGSEQSLLAGHRFHPAPKARQGEPAEWLPYAPEAGARFPLHWLAVQDELIAGEGDFTAVESLGPAAPDGYRLLPVHPWQLTLLADRPVLRRALDTGHVLDLGTAGPEAVPTCSIRTVYLPEADVFCKFSLDVRITNCVRKNSWYELAGSVVLSRLLGPVFRSLAGADGCRLLAEPAYRTVYLADSRLHEGLGVILRGGVADVPGTPLLAAALADPYGTGPWTIRRLPCTAVPEGALSWFAEYVRHTAPPVLDAYLTHGVVLEPHLQNVLMVVGRDGMPVQAVFRDLEGTKLVAGRWDATLAGLPARVREALTYDAERGWNRVVYCLLVNHLAEIAAAVADLHPELEPELWWAVRRCISGYAGRRAASEPLRSLLGGGSLPAKANLKARWARSADRAAGYVPVSNPLALGG